jgi:hypothetical protein
MPDEVQANYQKMIADPDFVALVPHEKRELVQKYVTTKDPDYISLPELDQKQVLNRLWSKFPDSTPKPSGTESPNATAGNIASLRAQFADEMKNPEVRQKLFALTHNEVSGQETEAHHAFMETVFNRALARGQTIRGIISDHRYYPKTSYKPVADKHLAPYSEVLDNVMAGSNISNLSTGNASGTVGFAGGPERFRHKGERFGVEGPDMKWVKRVEAGLTTPQEMQDVRSASYSAGANAPAQPSARPMPVSPSQIRETTKPFAGMSKADRGKPIHELLKPKQVPGQAQAEQMVAGTVLPLVEQGTAQVKQFLDPNRAGAILRQSGAPAPQVSPEHQVGADRVARVAKELGINPNLVKKFGIGPLAAHQVDTSLETPTMFGGAPAPGTRMGLAGKGRGSEAQEPAPEQMTIGQHIYQSRGTETRRIPPKDILASGGLPAQLIAPIMRATGASGMTRDQQSEFLGTPFGLGKEFAGKVTSQENTLRGALNRALWGFTTPASAVTLASGGGVAQMGKLATRLMSIGFSADMANTAVQEATQGRGWDAAVAGMMAAAGGYHGLPEKARLAIRDQVAASVASIKNGDALLKARIALARVGLGKMPGQEIVPVGGAMEQGTVVATDGRVRAAWRAASKHISDIDPKGEGDLQKRANIILDSKADPAQKLHQLDGLLRETKGAPAEAKPEEVKTPGAAEPARTDVPVKDSPSSAPGARKREGFDSLLEREKPKTEEPAPAPATKPEPTGSYDPRPSRARKATAPVDEPAKPPEQKERPSLGATKQEIYAQWEKAPAGPNETVVGRDLLNGGEYDWMDGKLYRLEKTPAKTGVVATRRLATTDETSGIDTAIDRGMFQVEGRASTGAGGVREFQDAGALTRVLHQSTGRAMEPQPEPTAEPKPPAVEGAKPSIRGTDTTRGTKLAVEAEARAQALRDEAEKRAEVYVVPSLTSTADAKRAGLESVPGKTNYYRKPSTESPVMAPADRMRQAKIDATLDTKVNYSAEGIISRRDWIAKKLSEGSRPEEAQVPDITAINKATKEMDQLRRQGEPSGNTNWPATKRYYELKAELASKPTRSEYRMKHSNDDWHVVTKTEYDYAVSQKADAGEVPSPPAERRTEPKPTAPVTKQVTPQAKQVATKFRSVADTMERQLEGLRRPMEQNPTPKRMKEYYSRLHDAENLERTQRALLALADAHENGTVPDSLRGLRTKDEVRRLVYKGTEGGGYYDVIPSDKYANTSPEGRLLQGMLEKPEVSPAETDRQRQQKITQLTATARFANIPGHFPTPKALAEDMAIAADIQPGMTVLEPSAGWGNIVDAIEANGVRPDVIEVNLQLRDILELKGYKVVGSDFLEHQGKYDRIVMNPPFEKGQDITHVKHAYDLLKPGGRLVSIMSEGVFFRSDKQATAFRNWLEENGGLSEKLPEGSFKESGTGTTTRLVTIDKPTDTGIRFSREGRDPAPVWYSKAVQVVTQKMATAMPSGAVKAMLINAGVKPDELKWSGLDELLAGKANVTKAEVLEHLAENNINVEEVTKQDQKFSSWESARLVELGAKREADSRSLSLEEEEEFRRLKSLWTRSSGGNTKYGQWQMPGAEPGSYRELLLTLPNKTQGNPANDFVPGHVSRPDFTSSHWDEPNVLAHIRFNDRVGPSGERILHIEEIQSDMHQAGRAKGYATKRPLDEIANERFGKPFSDLTEDEQAGARFYQTSDVKGAVPDAPFKKTWHELAAKRMLRYAAESGYDRVTWTPGEVQSDRYDMSKHVGKVLYDEGAKTLTALNPDKTQMVIQENGVTPEKLVDYIGKEAAQKLMDMPVESDGARILEGLDLKVESPGMKGFYDKILPDTFNKLGKRFGARVEDAKMGAAHNIELIETGSGKWRYVDHDQNQGQGTYIGPVFETKEAAEGWSGTPSPTTTAHSIPITESMRSAILTEGFPMFARDPAGKIKTYPTGDAVVEQYMPEATMVDKIAKDGHIYLTTHGRLFLSNLWSTAFRGAALDHLNIDAVQARLARVASDPDLTPRQRDSAKQIVQAFVEARKRGDGESVTLSYLHAMDSLTGAKVATREERAHRAIGRIGAGDPETRDFPGTWLPSYTIMEHPLAKKAAFAMKYNGYPDKEATLAEELVAKLVAGAGTQSAKEGGLGLSEAQAIALMEHTFRAIDTYHGPAAAQLFIHATATARRKYREIITQGSPSGQAQAKPGPEPVGRGGGQPAGLLHGMEKGRDSSPTGGVSSEVPRSFALTANESEDDLLRLAGEEVKAGIPDYEGWLEEMKRLPERFHSKLPEIWKSISAPESPSEPPTTGQQAAAPEAISQPPAQTVEDVMPHHKPGQPEGDYATGARKSITEPERAARGLPKVEQQLYKRYGPSYLEGREAVENRSIDPRKLASSVADKPRVMEPHEVGALAYDRMWLENALADAYRKADAAIGDKKALDAAKSEVADHLDSLDMNDQALKRGGREASAALAAYKMVVKEDYSLGTLLQKRRVTLGRALTETESTEVKTLKEQLDKAQAELAEHVARSAAEREESAKRNISRMAREIVRKRGDRRIVNVDERVSIRQRMVEKLTRLSAGIPMDIWPEVKDFARYYISKWVESGKGAVVPPEIIDSVHTEIMDLLDEPFDRSDVETAIGDYGIVNEGTDDLLEKEFYQVQRAARIHRQIEDARAGMEPLRSGMKPEPDSAYNIAKRHELRSVLKEMGMVEPWSMTIPQRQKGKFLRTEARIAELHRRLTEGDFSKPGAKEPIPSTPEQDALNKELETLVAEYNALKPPDDSSKLKAVKTRLDKQTKEIQAKLDAADYTPFPKRPKLKYDKEAEEKRTARDLVKAKLDEMIESRRQKPMSEKVENFLRELMLISPDVLPKLIGATITGSPIDSIADLGTGRFAGLLRIGGKPLRDIGAREGEASLSTELTKYRTFLTREPWKNAKDIALTGSDHWDLATGHAPKKFELGGISGRLFHATEKAIWKTMAARSSLEMRLKKMARLGRPIDEEARVEAYHGAALDGWMAILQNENEASKALNNVIHTLHQGKMLPIGFIARTIAQITRIPMNMLGRSIQMTGEGLIEGGYTYAKYRREYSKTKAETGTGKIPTPDQADALQRALKYGGLALAAAYLGLAQPDWFRTSGFFGKTNHGSDGKPMEADTLEIFGHKIPRLFAHNPFFMAIQFYATIRAQGSARDKAAGAGHALLGMAEQLPGAITISQLLGARSPGQFVGRYVTSATGSLGPLGYVARKQDTEHGFFSPPVPRKTSSDQGFSEDMWQELQKDIPGQRKNLPRGADQQAKQAHEDLVKGLIERGRAGENINAEVDKHIESGELTPQSGSAILRKAASTDYLEKLHRMKVEETPNAVSSFKGRRFATPTEKREAQDILEQKIDAFVDRKRVPREQMLRWKKQIELVR